MPRIDVDRPTPLLCATVTGATTAELCGARDRVTGADLVELRLDYVERPDVAGALAGRTTPVIVTCRPVREGGRFSGSERERLGLLGAALDAGAEFVDVEWQAEFQPLIRRHGGDRIVLSTHDFEGIPDDIGGRYRAMRATGAAVVKVAAATRGLCDTLALAALGPGGPAERRVVIGMGPAGIASRILAGRFGSCWTYAGDGVAPGQIELRRLRDEYRFPAITRRTAIYGVVGSPVSHSLSPAMHNAGFAA
ncbi:MAG: type I 3-dehydroquinate dehydratase, partial [Acidobacteria bacterium]|nr:type I 3-dehydroquinate dehydratase [Acidobacteriota bacterium]